MCELCVKEEYPDRENLCVEKGAYMLNFLKCSQCGKQEIKVANQTCTDTDDEEIVFYKHVCVNCEHVIAEHEYTFKVEGDFQIYEMSCLLCGTADDQRSIMPVDPRGPAM